MLEILNDFPIGYIFIFLFLVKIIEIFIEFVFNESKKWIFYTHIYVNSGLLNTHIYTLADKNYESKLKYLSNGIQRCRKYCLKDYLKDYDKFDIAKLNHANIRMVRKILLDKNDALILQRMDKPRDYFELVSASLINNKSLTISILTMDDIYRYFEHDFTVPSILRAGSHIFYDNVGELKDIYLRSYDYLGMRLYVEGDIEVLDKVEFLVEIKNKYFNLMLYNINEDLSYGVIIKENYLELDVLTLYYIAQFYNF